MAKAMNRNGQLFGRLTVMRSMGRRHRQRSFECKCTCGNFIVLTGSALTEGNTTSCGCRRAERIAKDRIVGAKKLKQLWKSDEFRKETMAVRKEVSTGRRLPNWALALPEDDIRRSLWIKSKQTELLLLKLRASFVPRAVQRSYYAGIKSSTVLT